MSNGVRQNRYHCRQRRLVCLLTIVLGSDEGAGAFEQ